MHIQTIIVGAIILAAVFYVGRIIFGKLKSFSSAKSCSTDCGCDSKAKPEKLLAQIKRN